MSKYHIATIFWIGISLGICFLGGRVWSWIALSTFIYLSFLVWGSVDIQFNFYLKSLNKLPSGPKQIALTFDDGPHPNTLALLDVLDKYQAKATFFCIGKQIEKYPDILLEIYRRGHRIGNHTYSHKNTFPLLTVAQMEQEIKKTNELILQITGTKPMFFRPPFGVTNPRIAKAIKNTCMKSAGWNRRSLDTVASREDILRRTADKAEDGDIVLFHDRMPGASAVVESYLEKLKGTGITYIGIY